jgi:hypothetical protein
MLRILFTLLVLVGLASSGQAWGTTIIYTESITTDGSLGGTAFTDKLVTLTLTADPSTATFSSGAGFTRYTNAIAQATVTVSGLGTATLSDSFQVRTEAYSTFTDFLVMDTTHPGTDILDTYGANAGAPTGFVGFTLANSFGPVSGGAAYQVNLAFATNHGDFEFTKVGGGVSTVTAIVPEPSTLVMAGFGVLGVLSIRRYGRGSLNGRD